MYNIKNESEKKKGGRGRKKKNAEPEKLEKGFSFDDYANLLNSIESDEETKEGRLFNFT